MTGASPSARSRWSEVTASWRRWLPWAVLFLVFTYPFWFDIPPFSFVMVDALGLTVYVLVLMLVYVMLALGLNIVVGYAGLLDLGYVAFFALGAYAVGWFASDRFHGLDIHIGSTAVEGVPGIHISFWIVLFLAGIVAAIAGVIIGWPTLRLRGDYLAIVTLGFGEIIPDVFRNADALPVPGGVQGGPPFIDFDYINLTDGVRGIRALDRPGFGGTLDSVTGGILPERFSGSEMTPWYFTIVGLVLITIFVIRRLERSKMGRAWIAVREDEVAASAMGIPLMRTKLWAYGIGAIFGGIVGAYYGSFIGSVFPTSFFFNISILILCMIIVGGMGNIWGVIVGALVIEYLNFKGLDKIGEGLNNGIDLVGIDQAIDIPKYKFLIFGTLLVIMMLARPEGLIPSARRKAELHEAEEGGPETAAGDLYDVRGGNVTDTTPDPGAGVETLLDAHRVRKEFGGLVAVNDVDFTIPTGRIVSLIGPNGAGKTTFFNILTGVYKPTAGEIVFRGTRTTGLPPHKVTHLGMARTFQNIRLFHNMSAVENVQVAMHNGLKGGIWASIFGTRRVRAEEAESEVRARDLLVYCGLAPRQHDEYSKNLPYGDQRRLEVARALAVEPALLLLDEPTAGMNPQETADFIAFVRRVRDERKVTVLLIEHDMKLVMDVSDRVTVLDYGTKISEGTPAEVQSDPRVIEAYLGTAATK